MASSSTRKSCANNNDCKQAAVTNCEGCSKAFCIKHMIDHRHLLDEEMNVIIDEHDHLKNTLNQQTNNPASHSIIKQIDEWEQTSIAKVQQRAKELRQELLQSTTAHLGELSERIQQLTELLKEGRANDDFIESDLEHWKKTLNDLKTDLISPSTISINRRGNVLFVHNIFVDLFHISSDIFERVFDNSVRIEENGKLVSRDNMQKTTEVRGKNEYALGHHEIRLRVEQLSGGWMFFGINSITTPLQHSSHLSKSAYGWSSNNCIWLNGQYRSSGLSSSIEMKTNDIITLTFDCDNRTISMINNRTNTKHELIVDIQKCPLPWQLHVILYESNSSVRILSD